MNQSMNIPLNIKEFGVSLEYVPKLVEDAMRSGNVFVNPRLTNAEDIQLIIERAYYGTLKESETSSPKTFLDSKVPSHLKQRIEI
ncbi:Uncharacterised protein [Acinetobacter baumannii]|nr:Uncharacterised protein [Acinetobacter baumannii]